MSIKKSNWSDLLSALAISDRERVRRLLASATMKARAVISSMKTAQLEQVSNGKVCGEDDTNDDRFIFAKRRRKL